MINPAYASRRLRGFTLIELMITVAIIALLASLAYPAYTDSVRKGRRAEGRTALLELMQAQERYLTQTGTYLKFTAGATGSAGTSATATGVSIPFKTKSGNSDSQAAYRLGAEPCEGMTDATLNACVRLFAVPIKADTEAGTLRMTSAGAKDCISASNTAVCWR